ncbi:MAG TPA: TatD family hydrolase [Anaerolineaceae bacterium]|nr:TatD family hydrolase [Anaerolineaceae bacterium]
MTYSDTHCHLDFDTFDADRDEVVQRALSAGLEFIINPGIDLPTSLAAVQLAKTYPGFCYAMVGLHPNESHLFDVEAQSRLAVLAREPGVVAIGEIGLDYYRDRCPPAIQHQALIKQLALAQKTLLPICVHNRDATADLFSILREWWQNLPEKHPLKKTPGVLHAWSENYTSAIPFMEMGFRFGIGGPVSFKNAPDRHEFIKQLPLEFLLLETDAPFLTPVPFRGRRNEPGYIPYIAEAVAKLKGMTAKEIGMVATLNAKLLFKFRETNSHHSG